MRNELKLREKGRVEVEQGVVRLSQGRAKADVLQNTLEFLCFHTKKIEKRVFSLKRGFSS